MPKKKLLNIENLSISFFTGNENIEVVHNISFQLNENEILGIVGESGSGKSVSSLAIMGLLPKKVSNINSGLITFEGKNLLDQNEEDFRKIRGKDIAMIFQEPMSTLNPSMRCGEQVMEMLRTHLPLTKTEMTTKVLSLFDQVQLPDPELCFKKYPHELSGGQKQRVMIAMALACDPKILIADEPTTALDVTVQKEIIALLKKIQANTKMSVIFITHDLSLISEIADRVLVMYKGDIVEQGETKQIFESPENYYTKALIASKPSLSYRLKKLPTISDFMNGKTPSDYISANEREKRHQIIYDQAPLLEIRNLEKAYINNPGFFQRKQFFKAVNGVSFKLYEGETLGLVGESGCGKSTLGKAILHLDKATSGNILYKGVDITNIKGNKLKTLRKDIQIIFQDPYSSLNPRLTVGQSIYEPMLVHGLINNREEGQSKVIDLLKRVGLEEAHYHRYPHEFSGGQRQRIGIARTIAVQPKIIICDESVSALDISVQAQVLNLLNELKTNFGFTYIFISHDLSVVKYMADQLLVMNQGKIEELDDADKIYNNPKSEYTQKLIDAIPKGL